MMEYRQTCGAIRLARMRDVFQKWVTLQFLKYKCAKSFENNP